jgi:hypothetical protein
MPLCKSSTGLVSAIGCKLSHYGSETWMGVLGTCFSSRLLNLRGSQKSLSGFVALSGEGILAVFFPLVCCWDPLRGLRAASSLHLRGVSACSAEVLKAWLVVAAAGTVWSVSVAEPVRLPTPSTQCSTVVAVDDRCLLEFCQLLQDTVKNHGPSQS